MTANPRTHEHSADPVESESPAGQPRSALDGQLASLRAENAALKGQLALRDQALDATSTFFVIARLTAAEPIIVYCNKVVADQHGFLREELLASPSARWCDGPDRTPIMDRTSSRH